MKTRVLLLILSLILCAIPTFAQDSTTTDNTISFNDFSLSFNPTLASNVNISQVAGTGPGELDVDAPHTEFVLYNGDITPDAMLKAPAVIRVYRTADFTGLETVQGQFLQLQTLLTGRGELSPYTMVTEGGTGDLQLPYLPLANAGQALRARAQYLDLTNVQGISYMTVFRQDVSPFTGSEFVYTFQGQSLDGQYYVSAVFRLNTDLFPAEIAADFDYEVFNAAFTDYLTESVTNLTQADSSSFKPSLADIDTVIQSFAFGDMLPSSDAVIPTITATSVPAVTDVNQDQTLGGLVGTWNLVSYGVPESQQPVLPNAPINHMVDVNGVTGSAGCNSYGGAFQYNAGAITFTNLISTLMACEDSINVQEAAYLAALTAATSYQINGNQLVINYPTGVLTFINAAAAVLTPTVEMTATATALAAPTATETATTTP